MAILYVHAGNHKSGSTTIQRFLHDHQGKIAESDVWVYSKDLQGRKRRGNLSWWFDHSALAMEGAKIKNGFVASVSDFSKGKDVVISSECFSWIFCKEELLSLKESLDNFFDKIVVIFYIRRQDVHAVSHYQQATKTIAEQKFYTGSAKALPYITENIYLYLDYNKRISNWGDVFGDQNVHVAAMDEAISLSGSLTKHFFSLLGISDIPEESKPSNASYGWQRTKVNHILNKSGVDPRSDFSKFVNSFLSNEGKLLPSRDDAKLFYEKFRESNKKLNDRFGVSGNEFIFDDDFNVYPEVFNDEWSEATANDAILNLIVALKSAYERVGG
ncbi:hypothetical protein [Halomonas elongata]|uniref:hypothetical protein n=1 Tax=Halomonas elongata TaxID=2746 RepID=UPI0023B0624F|nr:hypothetical protein [Halomonas elongata]